MFLLCRGLVQILNAVPALVPPTHLLSQQTPPPHHTSTLAAMVTLGDIYDVCKSDTKLYRSVSDGIGYLVLLMNVLSTKLHWPLSNIMSFQGSRSSITVPPSFDWFDDASSDSHAVNATRESKGMESNTKEAVKHSLRMIFSSNYEESESNKRMWESSMAALERNIALASSHMNLRYSRQVLVSPMTWLTHVLLAMIEEKKAFLAERNVNIKVGWHIKNRIKAKDINAFLMSIGGGGSNVTGNPSGSSLSTENITEKDECEMLFFYRREGDEEDDGGWEMMPSSSSFIDLMQAEQEEEMEERRKIQQRSMEGAFGFMVSRLRSYVAQYHNPC